MSVVRYKSVTVFVYYYNAILVIFHIIDGDLIRLQHFKLNYNEVDVL